jgi:phage terminase large subunit-like protein
LSACSRKSLIPEFLASLTAAELEALSHDWTIFARADQVPPSGNWTTWLLMGGRGAGKTRAGAEWVRGAALGQPPFAQTPVERIALVGETFQDAREVMVEGVSGLLAIHPKGERPLWEPSRQRLTWPNGAVAQVFSADDPDSLRGPQFAAAWLDEIGKWRHAEAAFDMLQFGLRLGTRPRQTVTTTPRPTALIRRLIGDARTVVSRAPTRANALNLAPDFLARIARDYAGSRLGRQELDGDLIEERADALWSRALLDTGRVKQAPDLQRIVVAVDPPASQGPRADACGIVVAGLASTGDVYVIADATLQGAPPQAWATRVAGIYREYEADAVVVEINQGGNLVETVLRQVDPALPVMPVRATRAKYLRAEPIAIHYAQGRVRHVGIFGALEDEMCDFGPEGLSSGRSPDRLDALVWAVTALVRPTHRQPRVRGI